MRNKEYKGRCFKLSDETYRKLQEIRNKEMKSWNLTFLEFIKRYEEKNK